MSVLKVRSHAKYCTDKKYILKSAFPSEKKNEHFKDVVSQASILTLVLLC